MKSKLHQELQNKAIGYLHDKNYWITRQEVPVSTSICDVWGITSASGNYATIAIEVKISRSDYRTNKYKELSSAMANRHYIFCPSGLISPDEIDSRWGLLWWNGNRIINKKQAQFLAMSDKDKLLILMAFLSSKLNKNKP